MDHPVLMFCIKVETCFLTLVGVVHENPRPKSVGQLLKVFSVLTHLYIAIAGFLSVKSTPSPNDKVDIYFNLVNVVSGFMTTMVVTLMILKSKLAVLLTTLMTFLVSDSGFSKQWREKNVSKISVWGTLACLIAFFLPFIALNEANVLRNVLDMNNSLLGVVSDASWSSTLFNLVVIALAIPSTGLYFAMNFGCNTSLLLELALLNYMNKMVSSTEDDSKFPQKDTQDMKIVRVFCLPQYAGNFEPPENTAKFQKLSKLLSAMKLISFFAMSFYYIPLVTTQMGWSTYAPGLFSSDFYYYNTSLNKLNGYFIHVFSLVTILLNQIIIYKTYRLTGRLMQKIFSVKERQERKVLSKYVSSLKDSYVESPCIFHEFDMSYVSTVSNVTILLITTIFDPDNV